MTRKVCHLICAVELTDMVRRDLRLYRELREYRRYRRAKRVKLDAFRRFRLREHHSVSAELA